MNDENKYKYIQALEQANMDYLRLMQTPSKEKILGHQLLLIKKNFPLGLLRLYKNHKKWKNIDLKVSKLSKISNEALYYNPGKIMNNVYGVAYTCITGGYDELLTPLLTSDSLDYIAFSDNDKLHSDTWKIKSIDKLVGVFDNYINRYYKLQPKIIFPDYDFSIYVDGNVQIISDVSMLYSIARESKVGIAMHKHVERDCLYDEGEACILHKRGNSTQIQKQMQKYENSGMPRHFGLLEATIIVVDLKNPVATEIMGQWWDEFNYWKSGRDQLAFPYVLWKNGYTLEDVGILGNNKFLNPKFRIGGHSEWRK